MFADIAAAGYARHVFIEIDDFYVEQFNAIAGIIFRNRFDDLFREMEKLGRSIEDSLFGRAVCFLVLRKMGDDLVRESLSYERNCLRRFLFFGDSGCNSFLDVARSVGVGRIAMLAVSVRLSEVVGNRSGDVLRSRAGSKDSAHQQFD